jgi:murein DD-endopeptidase MepM/ murein hydrolase activator NlpD
MAKDIYTILLIPEKQSPIRKVRLSGIFLKLLTGAAVAAVLALGYFSYDYVMIRGDSAELAQLKRITTAQKEQINLLAAKIDDFEKKMADIREFDRKIRVMTNIDNGRTIGQFLGVGGPSSAETIVESQIAATERALIDKIHNNMDQLLEEANYQEDSFKELLEFLKKQKSVLASTPSIWPVMGWVTSEFGYRISPFTGQREFHRGIDIATKMSEEVLAPANGKVVKIAYEPDMGNMLQIDHGNGIVTSYGHLAKIAVTRGKTVTRGDVVGAVGTSGRSTGPHLHYGIKLNGVYVNPKKYLF